MESGADVSVRENLMKIFLNQNTFDNVFEIIHIVKKCQINFDVLLETISNQTKSKCSWQIVFFPKITGLGTGYFFGHILSK